MFRGEIFQCIFDHLLVLAINPFAVRLSALVLTLIAWMVRLIVTPIFASSSIFGPFARFILVETEPRFFFHPPSPPAARIVPYTVFYFVDLPGCLDSPA